MQDSEVMDNNDMKQRGDWFQQQDTGPQEDMSSQAETLLQEELPNTKRQKRRIQFSKLWFTANQLEKKHGANRIEIDNAIKFCIHF